MFLAEVLQNSSQQFALKFICSFNTRVGLQLLYETIITMNLYCDVLFTSDSLPGLVNHKYMYFRRQLHFVTSAILQEQGEKKSQKRESLLILIL